VEPVGAGSGKLEDRVSLRQRFGLDKHHPRRTRQIGQSLDQGVQLSFGAFACSFARQPGEHPFYNHQPPVAQERHSTGCREHVCRRHDLAIQHQSVQTGHRRVAHLRAHGLKLRPAAKFVGAMQDVKSGGRSAHGG